jgi:hypothetical protein
MKIKSDKLQAEIEKALNKLLDVQSTKTEADREELRSNIRLAMQWKAIENKLNDASWGSGFTKGNGEDKDARELDD